MAYRIVAERDNQTVQMDRSSALMALAKARVWASEGWEVTIIDDCESTELAPVLQAYSGRLLDSSEPARGETRFPVSI